MDAGAAIFFTDYSIGPAALGRALEERGFGSLWAPEHSHIPLSRASAFPQGGELPKKYYDVMDPFVTLAAAAAATTALQVATGVCLVVQRDPIQTAKAVASLDQISGGALPLRHRGGLERRGDGRPWHRVQVALQGDAGARRGDAGHLDEAEAGVHRRVREVPPDDDVAQAGAEAAPPGARGRRVPLWSAPGDRLRRRLGAARPPARLRRRARQAARVPPDGRRGRARPGRPAGHRLRRGRGRRPHQALPRRGGGAGHLQPGFRENRRGAPRARSLRCAPAAGPVLMATHKPAFKQIASGLRFPEGPVAMPDGSVVLVEIERRTLSRVTLDGRVHVIATLGGGPNGAAIGPGGKVYVTNN